MQKIKNLLPWVLGLLMGITNTIVGQNFEGIAHYKSSRNVESINVGRDNMSPEMQESVRKQLARQMQRDYMLMFNLKEATWKEKQELDPVENTSNTGGVQIRISTGNSKSYINPAENLFLEETEIFGKKFLIEDKLPKYKWTITDEKKKIGDYVVNKATYTTTREQTMMSLSDSTSRNETIRDTTLVIAWYTPEIPVSQGPNNSFGLPGLILELKQNDLTFLCDRIELNPDEPVEIIKPSKGKKVSQEEASKIRREKMQEMMKKYDTGDGGTRHIMRIGG